MNGNPLELGSLLEMNDSIISISFSDFFLGVNVRNLHRFDFLCFLAAKRWLILNPIQFFLEGKKVLRLRLLWVVHHWR